MIPVISVINNTSAPFYTVAKLLVQYIKDLTSLKNGYSVNNSIKLAEDIKNLELHSEHKFVTVDVKDLYVNTSRVPAVLLRGNLTDAYILTSA
jgi:hypothetical protein